MNATSRCLSGALLALISVSSPSWAWQGAVPQNVDSNLWEVEWTRWDGDAIPDLVMIKKQAAGRTEVHIFSGESRYQRPLLQVVTGLHSTNRNWTFDLLDWDLDGTPDLWAVNKQAAGKVDLHILSGGSHFSSFVLQVQTALDSAGDEAEFLAVPPFSSAHSRPNLMLVKRAFTGSGTTEVHILDGGAAFRRFEMHLPTALGETGTGPNWRFEAGDFNGDHHLDVLALTTQGGGEIHVLDGSSNFQSFEYQSNLREAERTLFRARVDVARECITAVAAKVALVAEIFLAPPTGGASMALFWATHAAGFASDMGCALSLADLDRAYREQRRLRESGGSENGPQHDRPSDHRPGPEPEPPAVPSLEMDLFPGRGSGTGGDSGALNSDSSTSADFNFHAGGMPPTSMMQRFEYQILDVAGYQDVGGPPRPAFTGRSSGSATKDGSWSAPLSSGGRAG